MILIVRFDDVRIEYKEINQKNQKILLNKTIRETIEQVLASRVIFRTCYFEDKKTITVPDFFDNELSDSGSTHIKSLHLTFNESSINIFVDKFTLLFLKELNKL